MSNTATRLRRREKNRVIKSNPNGDSKIDLTGISETDVVWVKTSLGRSDFMSGRFIRMDESSWGWKYTALEVYKASSEQAADYLKKAHYVDLQPGVDRDIYYTVGDVRTWFAGWAPEMDWSGIKDSIRDLKHSAASHYYSNHPEAGYKPVKFKLDVNGADLGTYEVTVKLNPEYIVKEVR